MRPREILSKNLRALMDAHAGLGTIKKIVAASHGELSNGKVGRISAGTHATDIDALESLAKVFGVQPWQLLVENLNPKALPQLADLSLIHQIRQIVDSVPAPEAGKPTGETDEQALQKVSRRSRTIGPALSEAFDLEGVQRDAGSSAGGVQKPKARRRN